MTRPANLTLDFRTTNTLWGSVLVETLHRLGLRHAVISPGSRSAPLTVAFARHPGIESVPVLDERSAAFFALGLAKNARRPVVLVCTSGTAGANYFPAVIEAQESGVPLLVITADRPPEMRECRSGQTIDQQKLFGTHVNFYHELAVPTGTLPMLRYLRQTVGHAWDRARGPFAGPVHLNAPFRDPLAPVADSSVTGLKRKIDAGFFAHLTSSPAANTASARPELPLTGRGLIVAGPAMPPDPGRFALIVELLAHKTGWPVLADSLSPLRSFAAPGQPFVSCYDILVRNEKVLKKLRPDFVLSIGGWPISKPLRAWLERIDAPAWILGETGQNLDALHGRSRNFHANIEALADATPERKTDGAYMAEWTCADALVRAHLNRVLARIRWMFEGKVSWVLSTLLPAHTPVVLANSMPVRDVEYFWAPSDRAREVFCNRGANGIDGTLSTALGIAHGNRPAVLLTGDLALLHDANGFLLRPKFLGSLTVVLVNNRGGGIFEHLPVARFEPPFEDYFATPQQADFRKLCAAHGVAHTLVRDWKHFAKLISKLPARGIRVLEVRTDRKRDAALRRKLFAEAAAAVG